MAETIFYDGTTAFPKKYRIFGNICLTDKNERIFVCGLCKCVCGSPMLFWKHQREEHDIKTYEDVIASRDYLEYERETLRSTESRNAAVVKHAVDAMPSNNRAMAMTPKHAPKKTQPNKTNHMKAPILKKALKKITKKIRSPDISNEFEESNIADSNDNNFEKFITFCCPQCGKCFDTDAQWKQHTSLEHNFFDKDQLQISLYKQRPEGTNIFRCNVCHIKIKNHSSATLQRHKLTHLPFKSYHCRLCQTEIRHRTGIVNHMRSVHHKGREKSFACQLCDKAFYSNLQYSKHFQVHVIAGDLKNEFSSSDFTADLMLPNMQLNFHAEDGGNTYEPSEDGSYDASEFLITEMTEECTRDKVCAQDVRSNPNLESTQVNECIQNTDYEEYYSNKSPVIMPAEVSKQHRAGIVRDGQVEEHKEAYYPNLRANIKEEPPTEIVDIAEGYTTLWQEDVVIDLEQKIKQNKIGAAQGIANITVHRLECEVCYKIFSARWLLNRHIKKHGKKMDCRLCGVKITSLGALRKHHELKRCTASESK